MVAVVLMAYKHSVGSTPECFRSLAGRTVGVRLGCFQGPLRPTVMWRSPGFHFGAPADPWT